MGRKVDIPDSRIEGLKALAPALRELSADGAWLADHFEAMRPVPKRWFYRFENAQGQRLDCCYVWGGLASPLTASGLINAKQMGQRLADRMGCTVRSVRTHGRSAEIVYETVGVWEPS